MAIHKIKMWVSIGYANADREEVEEFEMPDDATPEEIEEQKESIARDWMNNFLDWGWADID